MSEKKLRFDVPTQHGDRFIDLADIIPAIRPFGLTWEMSNSWVVTKEGTPSRIREILNQAEESTVGLDWDTIEECAQWATQCNELTLRGHLDGDETSTVLQIEVFDSQQWEITVQDPSYFDPAELRPLGGSWVRVDEHGQPLRRPRG